MSEETIEIRQENEIKALEAIFSDELKDLRVPKAWNQWQPLNFLLTLTPQQGNSGTNEVYVKVDLHIMCSENYPNQVPEIRLENSKGMSDSVLAQLKQELDKKALELQGEVMVFELAQYVEAFLHKCNKPGPKSFYEEMLHRRKEQEQLLEKARRLEEDRERQVMLNEMQRVQDIIKSEQKSRKDHRRSLSVENSNDCNVSISESSEETCEHYGTKLIVFNDKTEIQRGQCINHEKNCVNFLGLNKTTGEMVVISEWTLSVDTQIASIEQEFNYLVKLHNINLSHYLNICQRIEEGTLSVYTMKEFEIGASCASLFLNENIPIDNDMLRHISMGVLNAVDFLHKNNIIHRDITPHCVFVTNKGVVKLSNYSIHKRLDDLSQATQITISYTKKTDIYCIGTLIIALIRGSDTSNDVEPEIPMCVSNNQRDFLEKCIARDERERQSAGQLLRHVYLKTPQPGFIHRRSLEDDNIYLGKNDIDTAAEVDLEVDFGGAMHSSALSGQSRMQNDFEVLQWLGKGAFGDVLKVRNKLDGGYYAIKRIELNPKNKQLNRKITREVKLLSRLNHENVVRYYNSWIESAMLENSESSLSQTSTQQTTQSSKVPPPAIRKNKELTGILDNVELLAPPMRDVEWSISYSGKSKPRDNFDVGEDDDDDEDEDSSSDESWCDFGGVEDELSDSIAFENSSDVADAESIDKVKPEQKNNTENNDQSNNDNIREYQFMYIQMEFCEKSTLRTAIDGELCRDMDRVWRLFREIVDGLAHIHQQGMIHRDLKPVNIFLDSNDHVKIGDFGLATTNVLSNKLQNDPMVLNKSIQESEKEIDFGVGDSLTGQVGTALYVAPELTATTKAIYNQKVDLYSLGIILFEMCFVPLPTSMERIKILSGLRYKEITFPQEFELKTKQEILIRWLLNHDVSLRPTSQELLQSELIPPPVLEEAELRELVRHTLSNPQRKAYKYLVASCFGQQIRKDQDIAFDVGCLSASNFKGVQMVEYVKNIVVKIFKLHGGQCLNTPLLMPKNKYYEGLESCVRMMTHSGNIVSIPYDLRIPFARYIARNNITMLRRYSIDRVYREKKPFGFYPRELYECAFDIVTPTSGMFMVEAELLSIAYEIINQFSVLKQKNFLIRLNHSLILKAILLHCGIKSEKHADVYTILSDARDGKVSKFQVKTHLISLCLNDSAMLTLFNLIESEAEYSKVASTLQTITKRKNSEASQLVKQGLQELKQIIHNAEALGVQCNMVLSLGLVFNVQQQYSGMICQFVCELKKKRRRGLGLDVLAAGGRYDTLIATYRTSMERMGLVRDHPVSQTAAGISLSLDKLVQALMHEGMENDGFEESGLDCVICSLGTRSLIKEKAKILRELWTAGIRASLLEAQNIEEIQEQCSDMHVTHVVILKDTEQGTVRIRSWERDRFQERKINTPELVEFMQRLIKQWNEGTNDLSVTSTNGGALKVDSKSSRDIIEHSHDPNLVVVFVTVEKLSANTRKRYENQIKSLMDKSLKYFSGDIRIIVMGVSVDAGIVRTLVSMLNFDSETQYNNSVLAVIERHPRHKKYLTEICDEISEFRSERNKPVIALYSLTDCMYKFFL